MEKPRGIATIGFSIKAIAIMIKPRESPVNAMEKNAKNKTTKGMRKITTCFQRVMDENLGIKFSLRKDCL